MTDKNKTLNLENLKHDLLITAHYLRLLGFTYEQIQIHTGLSYKQISEAPNYLDEITKLLDQGYPIEEIMAWTHLPPFLVYAAINQHYSLSDFDLLTRMGNPPQQTDFWIFQNNPGSRSLFSAQELFVAHVYYFFSQPGEVLWCHKIDGYGPQIAVMMRRKWGYYDPQDQSGYPPRISNASLIFFDFDPDIPPFTLQENLKDLRRRLKPSAKLIFTTIPEGVGPNIKFFQDLGWRISANIAVVIRNETPATSTPDKRITPETKNLLAFTPI